MTPDPEHNPITDPPFTDHNRGAFAVSVVIPARNARFTLPRCLESVAAQPDHLVNEVIVVDDGSTDGSAEIARSVLADDGRIVVVEQEPTGAAAARNVGIERSTSEWVAFLDADDSWFPKFLESMASAAAEHPDAGLIYGSFSRAVDGRDEPERCRDFTGLGPGTLADIVEHGGPIMTSVTVVRRAALRAVDGFDASMENSHDADLWFRLAPIVPFVHVPEPLGRRAERPHSLGNRRSQKLENLQRAIDKVVAQRPELAAAGRRRMAQDHALWAGRAAEENAIGEALAGVAQSLLRSPGNAFVAPTVQGILRAGRRGLDDLRSGHQAASQGALADPDLARALVLTVQYPAYTETYIHDELVALRAAGHDVSTLAFRHAADPRRSPLPFRVLESAGTDFQYGRYEDVDHEFLSPTTRSWAAHIEDVMDAAQPDVLHAHYLGLAVVARHFAERHSIPFTVRTHSFDVLDPDPRRLRTWCEAANSSWCRRVLVLPGFGDRLEAAGLDPDKIVECPPVLDLRPFTGIAPGPATSVVAVSAGNPKKGMHEFVNLAAMMRDRGFDFDIYGRGPAQPAVIEWNKKLGNPVRMRYADPEEMPAVYAKYGWLIYPTSRDITGVGQPVAILQAMAAGLGVCWQRLPDRPDQAQHLGGAGFLFDTMEDVVSILSDPYPEEKRAAGRASAARTDIGRHLHRLTDAWPTDRGRS